jgi:gas vesicle protein
MSDNPDVIRENIEQTRRELGGDVDALADKVTPSKIMERQTDKVRSAVGSVRDRIMGAADDAGSSLSDAGSSAASHVGDVKDRVVGKAEGNPMAVGLIAFGAGLLLASLIPASRKERELAENVKEQAQPLVDELGGVAKDVGEHLKEPARNAATAVKESAQDSVENVKDEAKVATAEVKDQAQHAKENVSGSRENVSGY